MILFHQSEKSKIESEICEDFLPEKCHFNCSNAEAGPGQNKTMAADALAPGVFRLCKMEKSFSSLGKGFNYLMWLLTYALTRCWWG